MLYSRNEYNIIKQLSSIKKNKWKVYIKKGKKPNRKPTKLKYNWLYLYCCGSHQYSSSWTTWCCQVLSNGIVKQTKKQCSALQMKLWKLSVNFFLLLFCFKASLTLEEKQKLAKEQEQAQKLKSQQPLKPQVHTPIAPVKQVRVHFFVCNYATLKE